MEKEEKKPEIFDLETHKILEPESFYKKLKELFMSLKMLYKFPNIII